MFNLIIIYYMLEPFMERTVAAFTNNVAEIISYTSSGRKKCRVSGGMKMKIDIKSTHKLNEPTIQKGFYYVTM